MKKRLFALISLWAIVAMPVCLANVSLAPVFTDHMVLQRDMPLPVWGWAAPKEKVSVRIDDQVLETRADQLGTWRVTLSPLSVGQSREMTVTGVKNAICVSDILVGEVWICSGQSNMEKGLSEAANPDEEIAKAVYPNIRFFTVPRRAQADPIEQIESKWTSCTADAAKDFSAVAYYFGRELERELKVPIGLVATAYSGTRIEPWIPRAGFESMPSLASYVEKLNAGDREYIPMVPNAMQRMEIWLPRAKKALEKGERVPLPPDWPLHPLRKRSNPCALYNGMIYPLVPFAMRGVIWYQGESNVGDGPIYTDKMQAMVKSWRSVWGEGDSPFYFVQPAPFEYSGLPVDEETGIKNLPNYLPELWEAQTAAFVAIPNSGMVVTTDLGELKDIHPKRKQPIGRRLALWALAHTYGRTDLVYSGPLFDSMSAEGDKIRIRFKHAEGLKSTDGKPLAWFEIAGEDGKFAAADATIDNDTVLVSAKKLSKPVSVRFGWSEIAQPNLANGADLPASPFRTSSSASE